MFIVLVLTNYFGCKEHQDRRLSPYHQAGRVVFLGHRTLCPMGGSPRPNTTDTVHCANDGKVDYA